MLGDERRDPVDCAGARPRRRRLRGRAPGLRRAAGRIRAVLRRASGAERDRLHAGELVVHRRTRDVCASTAAASRSPRRSRAAAGSSVRADPRVHERRAPAGGLGPPARWTHPHARQRCVAAGASSPPSSARPWVVNHVGRGGTGSSSPTKRLSAPGHSARLGRSAPMSLAELHRAADAMAPAVEADPDDVDRRPQNPYGDVYVRQPTTCLESRR